MKDIYPEYRKLKVTTEDLYKKLSTTEQKLLDDFLKKVSIGAGEGKVQDIKTNLVQFRDIIGASLDKVTIDVLRDYLIVLEKSERTEWTKNGAKNALKRFLKFTYKDWSQRFEGLEDIKQKKAFNEEKINADTLITGEELKSLCHASKSYRDKALVMTLYETGCRPQELRSLRWKNITFNTDGTAKVSLFSGKTESARTVLIKVAVIELQDHKQHYPFSDVNPNDLIFPSAHDRKISMSKGMVCGLIKRLGERAKLDRPIFPYLLRHSRLSELTKSIGEPLTKKFAGHTRNSQATAIYQHMDADDVIDSLLSKVYKVTKVTKAQQNKYDKKIEVMQEMIANLAQMVNQHHEAFRIMAERDKLKELKGRFPIINVKRITEKKTAQ